MGAGILVRPVSNSPKSVPSPVANGEGLGWGKIGGGK